MTQPPPPDWSARLALSVAREVRRHRQAQGLSAQQLADRCAEIGMPIQRSVLANLESGRRTTVNLAEVLVLAAALEVPPVTLVFPVGYAREAEMLPDVNRDPLFAADWFAGESFLDDASAKSGAGGALSRARQHHYLAGRLRNAIKVREAARSDFAAKSGYAWAASEFEKLEERAKAVVEEMRILDPSKQDDADRWNELQRQRAELSNEAARLADAAHTYNYAKNRADRAENSVNIAEEKLRAYRRGMMAVDLTPPALPSDLTYVDPENYQEEVWGGPYRSYPPGVGWRGWHERTLERERSVIEEAPDASSLMGDAGADVIGELGAPSEPLSAGAGELPAALRDEVFIDLLAQKVAERIQKVVLPELGKTSNEEGD